MRRESRFRALMGAGSGLSISITDESDDESDATDITEPALPLLRDMSSGSGDEEMRIG